VHARFSCPRSLALRLKIPPSRQAHLETPPKPAMLHHPHIKRTSPKPRKYHRRTSSDRLDEATARDLATWTCLENRRCFYQGFRDGIGEHNVSSVPVSPHFLHCGAVPFTSTSNSFRFFLGWSNSHLYNIHSNNLVNSISLKMHTSTSLIALSLLSLSSALPQRNRNGGGRGGNRQQQASAQQQAAQVPQGLSQAQDGSVIMDDTVMVKYVLHSPTTIITIPTTFPCTSRIHEKD
jgi:hypothetical protein